MKYTKAIFEFNGKIYAFSNKEISDAMVNGRCDSIDLTNTYQFEVIQNIILSLKDFWTAQDMDALAEMDKEVWQQCIILVAQ